MKNTKKAMGRPKADNPRCVRLNIRLTPKEKAKIEENAKKNNLTITDYVVKKLTK